MEQVQAPLKAQLPSFSIVLETENLANADLNGLSESLASLANQDLSPSCANEVWLIDSGDTPIDLLEQLCNKYPWIKVHQAPLATGYYTAKMLGAELSTGEIIVYFDSDCIYQPNWLRNLLTPFTQGDTIQIVAGETKTRGLGIYGTAMALAYIFPPYSGQKNLTATSQYFLNNVAFRREFLLKHPIPTELSLYRGNCAIHAHKLVQQGYTIWKQPQAKATHSPPNGLSHFFWRFLLIGHDYYWQKRLLAPSNTASPTPASSHHVSQRVQNTASSNGSDPQTVQLRDSMSGFQGKLRVLSERVGRMLADEPRHLLYLPFAIPVIITSVGLIFVGYVITLFKADYLPNAYSRIQGEV
jgi:glycosyltransferase involved in cell wall biosynthesis